MIHCLSGVPTRARPILGLLAVPLIGTASACAGPDRPSDEIVVGFVADSSESAAAALRGARLGAEEAAHAGELVGRSLTLLAEEADSPARARAIMRDMVDGGAVAVLGGFEATTCRALAETAGEEAVPFLNLGCRGEEFRSPDAPMTWNVEASEAMYRGAAEGGDAGDSVLLWHSGLNRYGAAQLNDRFLRDTGAPADAPGWAGWMAVKAIWESLLEEPATNAESLVSELASPDRVFDGHKGQSLRFAADTRQLQQPLFPASPGARGGGSDEVAREELPEIPYGSAIDWSNYLFVSNERSADITAVDRRTNTARYRIPVDARPRGIHVDPRTANVYVALSDDAPLTESDADAVVAIDLENGGIARRIEVGSDPEQFGLSPDGRYVYAANEDAGTASVTDLETGAVLATLVVGIEPEGVAVSPDGRWAYVTAETSNTVSVIDTERNEVVASFLVDARPRGVIFSPTRPRAYVTNEISGTLSIVDTEDHQVIDSVLLDQGAAKPVGVAVSPDGERIFVANGHAHSVSVVDAATHEIVAEVAVGRRPWGITISPDGRWIYTANGVSNDVSVIDAGSLGVVATIPVGDGPWGVALSGETP